MQVHFDHEKLRVYRDAIELVEWVTEFQRTLPKKSVADQLDRASTSVALNIAEGNGKFTPADRYRYFDNARGSALECAACLDVCVAKRLVNADAIIPGKQRLQAIVSMLVGLIRSNSDRVYESRVVEYHAGIPSQPSSQEEP
jgi:four helix bundle protein